MLNEMQAGRYVDPADDYELTAEVVADHFGRHILPIDDMAIGAIKALLIVPQRTLDDIEADPYAFDCRVRDYLYALAMRDMPEEP